MHSLAEAGLEIVERNWRCRQGEIDIVARDGGSGLCARHSRCGLACTGGGAHVRGETYGSARESVNWRKQAKLRTVAEAYVQQAAWTGPWRIDVVAVQVDGSGRGLLEHIRNAVRGV